MVNLGGLPEFGGTAAVVDLFGIVGPLDLMVLTEGPEFLQLGRELLRSVFGKLVNDFTPKTSFHIGGVTSAAS